MSQFRRDEPVMYGFTGREFDPESGLYYYRARMYDPRIGRFMTKDPIGFSDGDANLYRYVGNNPMRFVDPHGLEVIDLTDGKKTAAIRNDPAYLAAHLDPNVIVIISDKPGLTFKGKEAWGSTSGDAKFIQVFINPGNALENYTTLIHKFAHVDQLRKGETGRLSEFEPYLKENESITACPRK